MSKERALKKRTRTQTKASEPASIKLVRSAVISDTEVRTACAADARPDVPDTAGSTKESAVTELVAETNKSVTDSADTSSAANTTEPADTSSAVNTTDSADNYFAANTTDLADSPSAANPTETAMAKPTALAGSAYFTNYLYKDALSLAKYAWSLRAPLFLLAAVAVAPKTILLWIAVVLLKPLCMLVYSRLPKDTQLKITQSIPAYLRNSALLRDYGEGANQCLPFILFWIYLSCAPIAVLWIAGHYIRGLFPQRIPHLENGLVFAQNKKSELSQPENNFYYSRAFAVTTVAIFALGIPAIFSYSIYKNLGVGNEAQKSSTIPPFVVTPSYFPAAKKTTFVGQYPRKPRIHNDPYMAPRYVAGYNGYWPMLDGFSAKNSEFNFFFVHFYLVSLACAMSVLFFRAWFFFPLNFLSDQHELYLNSTGIRRSTLKNWFLNVLTVNRWAIGGGPDSLSWTEIKSLRHLEEGFTKLSPLPETAFKKESLTYKLLNKLAAFIDGLSNRVNTGNYLIFSTSEKDGDFGRNIKININELNREQRAKLFYSVKNWAPHVVIRQDAQESLTGSVVLQDVKYTQLWFDLLTSKTRVKRQSVLEPGETLHESKYTIEERLSAGGQATAYLARTAENRQVVLKEFILAIASTPGALLESAREFETEVSLLSQLNHPGIVKLEDFFSEDGRVYVVLEYIQGQTVRQKVQQDGPLSETEAIKITGAVCDVLEYMHKLDPPIVHRDITPENILVLPDGSIKLIDFSLAVKSNGTRTTDSCGKQAFTPPEQFRDEVCPASDIYGLGATIYFMLTGLPPKPITVSSPKQRASNVSDEMNQIVERATQLDLNQRYDSIHWLKLDLARCKSVP
ncbi:MAG: serine/threonine protein kinase [Candidatus Melainabacteria bacterium]|nr:MAG: serine/threonine protein kinase [Candidatus Melainabacteria bacterium]